MRKFLPAINFKGLFFLIVQCIFLSVSLSAQQTTIADYVLFGGNGTCAGGPVSRPPAAPGYAVQIGASSVVQGGSVGSYRFIKSTGGATINANIYSGGTIHFVNGTIVKGNIAAANSLSSNGPVLLVGSAAKIDGNIDVKGDILIAGGVVHGRVTHPAGTTYSGPVPGRGDITGTPALPSLPANPPITNFPACTQGPAINSTQTIKPGAYSDIKLTGNKTLTLSGPGVYIFDKIDNKGGCNYFIFDFKNNPSGTFKIYVHKDADLGKLIATTINGGHASRIFTEIHGNGTACANAKWAFNIENGSMVNEASTWLGTVWAPYGPINIGAGSGNSNITGALWSGTQVNIQCGVKVIYCPFVECSAPGANAGPDKALDFQNQTTLTGSSTAAGATFSWRAINGGVITSPVNAAAITVSTAGTYILTVISGKQCTSTDTAVVSGKSNNLIGSELQSIFQNFDPNGPPSPFFAIQHDSIVIDVITKEGAYAQTLALLTSPTYGLTNIISNGTSNFIITGLFPIKKLNLLNALTTLLVYVRPYYGAINNSGIVTTAGDISMRANLVRDGYNLQGAGVKVGVISDSYNTIQSATTTPITNTAAQDVGNGDLPGPGNPNGNLTPVHVLQDYPIRRSDEGRAMLQIVHDVAPKAELYFRTGFFSPGDFANGIEELNQAGCNVIVDDVTFITEPFLKDGIVAAAVDDVTAKGTAYFSAAGNFAGKSYENSFNPVPAPGGINGTAHNFGGNDVFQNVTLAPGNYTIVLQWLDDIYSMGQTSAGGTKNDLDIYLTPNTNGTALFGFNRNNTNGDPIEILPFTITSTTNTNILITNNTIGSTPARFKYIVFRGEMVINEYNTGGSTISGQANALGAIAVGAVRYDKAPPFAGPIAVESFSSTGGTFINNVQRQKPDLVAPDGVNTTVNLGQDYDNNSFSNFFGTSAAAPHAAAVAALVIEGRSKFLNQPTTTSAEVRTILQSSATNIGNPGFDFTSGYGFINADSAIRTFAKPKPVISQLVLPANVIPGQAPFTLTVRGTNLSYNSVIHFRDSTLATTIISSEEAMVQIPAFFGNPAITVYTPPISASKLDGGTSDTLHFFDVVKKEISIAVQPVTKKYAEQLPAFTATILADGQPLENAGLTPADLGLSNLTFTTLATPNSNVGTYIITPSRIFNPLDPVDIGLLEKYEYTFTTGNITIEKMPLLVTPVDKTINYGQHVGEITFNYQFDQSNVQDPASILDTIKTYHQAFLPNNALAVIKDGSGLTDADLSNLNMMASFNAVKNSRMFRLENGKLVPVSDPNTFNIQYLVDVSVQSIAAYKSNPASSSFINAFPGISSKAILSANSLVDNTGTIQVNGRLVQIVNGTLVQMVNGETGPLAPILNGTLVQIVNGRLVQIVNGEPVPIANSRLVQIVNGRLVQLVNAEFVPIANGTLVQLVNGTLVQIVNSRLVQIVNGAEEPVINGTLVQIVNGRLVQLVNGVPEPIANGRLVQLVNGSLVQLVNGNLAPIANGRLVQIVNGSLVQLVNGRLVQIVNGHTIGAGAGTTNNNTAVIIDETDVDFQTNWIGPMFGINMITGLDAGQQKLVPGVLVNDNFDISYGTGKVNILPATITITPTPGQSKIYQANDPAFTFTNDGGIAPGDFTGSLGRAPGNNVGGYAYTLNNLSAGVNYTLNLSSTDPISTFTIVPKSIIVTPVPGQCKTYGDPDPLFKFTNDTGLAASDFTGKLGRVMGENVGNYAYTAGTLSAGSNYNLTVTIANTFRINKALLKVEACTTAIFKGDPIPAFKSIITGLKNGDNPTVSYHLSPACAGNAGVYTIIPLLNNFAGLTNYAVSYSNGKLYINPKGYGAKKLRPYLDCIEQLSGGKYMAHYYCINDNATPVYISAGANNNLTSDGIFEGSNRPFIFMPGITKYNVVFDGSALKWEIKSYDCDIKTSVSAIATTSSPRCNTYSAGRVAAESTLVKSPLEVPAQIIPAGNIGVFPNPAVKRATVFVSNESVTGKGLSLFDSYGKLYPVRITKQISKHAVEIDFSGLASGVYFVRVKVSDGYKTIKVIKE